METPRLPGNVELRRATADDAEAGARLHMACWREAYGPITDPALLDPILSDEDAWAERWRRQIDDGAERTVAVVKPTGPELKGPELIGFSAAGSARQDQAPTERELQALYVREAWHGTGVGTALLSAAIGADAASLWVLEDNLRARAFYVKQGFSDGGGRKLYENLDAWEIQLVRP